MKNDYANSKMPSAVLTDGGRVDRFLSKRLNFVFNALALPPPLDVACHFETCAPMIIDARCLNKRCPQRYAVTWKKTVVTRVRIRHANFRPALRQRGKWKRVCRDEYPDYPLKRCQTASPPPPPGAFFNAGLHKEGREIIHFPCIHHALYRMFIRATGSWSHNLYSVSSSTVYYY